MAGLLECFIFCENNMFSKYTVCKQTILTIVTNNKVKRK